jgi:chromosome segregation ATPase
MVSDHDRRELFEALERQLGDGPAAILMELLPPVGWADVARSSELAAQGVAFRGEMAEVRGEMAEVRGEMAELRAELKGEMAEVRGEMAGLRAELKGEMAEVRGEMAGLRAELKGELAELRGDVRAQLPKLITANIASMLGVAGLVLGAAKLA